METDKNEDPAWLNSKNDRKTPYTDEEIEYFVNDFIQEFPEHYNELVKNDGPIIARLILRDRFKAKDENRNQI
ncbi:MAG: hypothetical protein A2268_10040 [Candidatus Raymondbacteria bacterium RifOxyA12_full_50_37]|uniref:Uncharacterized protein n=1 Tax=Candidatus Raymondbacteria bacterium RIFOXYD12_FULL_49_13 TaxID=1817890 RepID=A0A1F7F3Y9_UNCRA|nr:MAG: hypothetical protein A2268_10040 [Candidatus Raymondbacteria bacterium RifOxyA12_full_50_37]OGJ93822.1 MAG: hypothetical protein A2248_06260 [Candidatus Raymondbacteria bacterium RIFOXYA2_FULL_49_16]OGJ98311.1 MAG: hypothetical protein A2453_00915 [Candidatus Raymondbacteria bacterium RIFOXYC2_FULL_50_21]OGK01390.1 MAG: hypothetical protein A2519_14850 [Candidatus Raymondbacteria bacterium RIFOXYD12_FULL_49_13]OGK04084.1 MAG: hypothetical protein A2350_05085 [Candidatus Raymondbacteria 